MQRPEPLKKEIKDCNLHDLETFHAQMKSYIAHLELENEEFKRERDQLIEHMGGKDKIIESLRIRSRVIIYHMAKAIKFMGE